MVINEMFIIQKAHAEGCEFPPDPVEKEGVVEEELRMAA
jgi:hypothetical protein